MLEELAPPTIVFAHMIQVAGEVSLIQKIRQGYLLQNGSMDIDKASRRQQRFDELGRCNHISQAQSRKKNFAKGADIEHPSSRIKSLEGFQGTPTQAIFAIVIVLQNPGPHLSGPIQQGQPTAQAHRDSCGKLM